MKLPCFVYSPRSRESQSLKDCTREALHRLMEMERIGPVTLRELACGRAFRIVRWANKRWPSPEPRQFLGLPTLLELDAQTMVCDR